MKKEASQELHIRELEEKLLQPGIWRSTEGMSELLADEFMEFGSSGRIYSKQQVIEIRRRDPAPNVSIADFRLRLLGRDVMMATYRVEKSIPGEEGSARSLRSSIWKLARGRWQMVFHQGTPLPNPREG